jgi:predicted acyl esterase
MKEHEHQHIPLKGSTYGIQYAGWKPSAVAFEGLGSRTLADQFIPVGDGAELHADVYLPKAEGRYPAVLSFAAYSSEFHTAGNTDRHERDRLTAGVHRPRLLPGDRRTAGHGPLHRRAGHVLRFAGCHRP